MKDVKEIAQSILGMALADYTGLERQFENDTAISVGWIEEFIASESSVKDLLQRHKDKKGRKMLEVINEIQHEIINAKNINIEKIRLLCAIIQPEIKCNKPRKELITLI